MDSKPPAYDGGDEKQPPPPGSSDSKLDIAHTQSQPVTTAATSFRTNFASVSLHMTDRIRFLGFSSADVTRIYEIIQGCWPKGIQSTREYGPSDEIRLRGNPWRPSAWFEDEKTAARRLVCGLLRGLYDMGWVLKSSVDVLKKEGNKDTLLFRFQQPPPPRSNWLCISFNKSDLLQLIDAPEPLCQAMVNALGDKVQRTQFLESSFEIKFHGYPWKASGTETVETRLILLNVLDCLEQFGFTLYASINQDTNQSEQKTEADTWFCQKQTNWAPGAPIYHG
ncbi:uncharacterized protein BDCG_02475 [Blastomyces dermatitidis ER-3]|uniref:Uncharacterized protein n=2 Tax=Ajellomyces dermatitidis TaxID=5039 RepID=F2T3R1_AJEDA|nr:uncharacterized protein BDCG_02475 [Blastomyces dermatitidis ER-3]EEQ87355.1 hypothetical protein BDCG_02475 [Blastomyces dermatitidis ER-3]EGE78063.1 hypothetical protein BDDG_01000 [Blastomyces dermatitidis ATCC 18188]